MKRRDFINRTAVLGSAAILPLGMSQQKQEVRYKLGYQLYSVNVQKVAFSAFDDKRYILDNGYETLAHGHYQAR